MHITHSYLGTPKGEFRCLFFLLLEDYLEAQTQFAKELELALERFARNMKHSGVLVRPFTGDIETTRNHVLKKNWTIPQLEEIGKTPGLLMIEVDFDAFDPREHRWLHFCFGTQMHEGVPGSYAIGEILARLAAAVCDAETDVFRVAYSLKHEALFSEAAKIFEAKPGIFGFSVDLIKGAELVTLLHRKLTSKAPDKPRA